MTLILPDNLRASWRPLNEYYFARFSKAGGVLLKASLKLGVETSSNEYLCEIYSNAGRGSV